MDRFVRVFTYGTVNQTRSGVELVGMEGKVLVFGESPSFSTVVTRIKSTLGCMSPVLMWQWRGDTMLMLVFLDNKSKTPGLCTN